MGVLGVNHIAFRTPDPEALKAFYTELLAAERLVGEHDPIRVGQTILVFFRSELGGVGEDSDEIAFDADANGFEKVLVRARAMGCVTKEPVAPTPWSRAFLVADPDGRRIEITYDDRGVYWRE